MPVSPIGNMNFINQNMALPATQVSNELAKENFAAMMNLNELKEKEKLVDKLDKVPQAGELKDEVKERSEEERKQKEREKNEEDLEESEKFKEENEEILEEEPKHRLDLSI